MLQISTSSALLAAAVLIACGPAPSGVDAKVISRDAGRYDHALPDHAAGDSRVDDRSAVDRPGDAAASDAVLRDAATSDQAAGDSWQPDGLLLHDAIARDATPFNGPYQAEGLPKLIEDAAINNAARATDTLIYARDNAATPFVDVYVTIDHADSHDLVVQLIPASGNTSQLFSGDSCVSGNCPRPLLIDTRLSVSGSTLGNWVLRVTDRFTGQTGMLQAYQLTFSRF